MILFLVEVNKFHVVVFDPFMEPFEELFIIEFLLIFFLINKVEESDDGRLVEFFAFFRFFIIVIGVHLYQAITELNALV